MNVSFGWKYSHLCPVYFNQTLIPLSMSNSSIQSKRYLGGRFCEHAIQQGKRTYYEKPTFTWDLLCRDFLDTSTLTFLYTFANRWTGSTFSGVTNDIRNHERLEILQKKKKKEILNFLNILFLNCRKSRKRKCKKKNGAKHKRQRWINKIIFLRSWITYLLPRWGGINTGCITDKYIN